MCWRGGGRWHKRATVSDPVTPQRPHKRFGWSVEISAQFGRTRLLLYSKQFHGHARTMYLVTVALYEYAWLLERKPPNALSPSNFKEFTCLPACLRMALATAEVCLISYLRAKPVDSGLWKHASDLRTKLPQKYRQIRQTVGGHLPVCCNDRCNKPLDGSPPFI